jgi:hypothetical protein
MNVPQSQRAASPHFSDAEGEIQRGMEVAEFATGAPQLLKSGITENAGTGVLVWVGCSDMASFLNYGDLVEAVGSNAAAAWFAAIHRPDVMERRRLLCAKNSGGARLPGPCK